MIYDCFEQVAHLSEAFTLEPGDVIATGTPAGIGAVRKPFPEGLLKVGDIVRVEIDGIGSLENTVVDEPEGFVADDGRGAGMGALTAELARVPRWPPRRRARDAVDDGRPRQSVVYYVRDGERLLISTESKRLKARDVRRTGWASLCVLGHEQPHPSAVFSGPAEILTEDIGPATAPIMQRIAGDAGATRAADATRRSRRRPGHPGDHGRARRSRELPGSRGCQVSAACWRSSTQNGLEEPGHIRARGRKPGRGRGSYEFRHPGFACAGRKGVRRH